MAEKHKTKYKSPKDLEKSTKPNTRKDIKDYAADDAHGMVPGLTKGVQPLVVRKYATNVIADVENMVPKIVDHIYKKVESGEYSPEHARKVFEKMQLAQSKDYIKKLDRIDHVPITNSLVKPENEETLKEVVSKLSEQEKEQVIRKYVRNKIAKVLRENYVMEQGDTDVVEPEVDTDVDTPEVDTDVDTPDVDVDVDTPEADVDVDTPDIAADSDTPAPTSFSGGGGSSSSSPAPTPAASTSNVTPTTSTPTTSTPNNAANKMKATIDSFVADIQTMLANGTPIEVAPQVVQPIKDLLDGMTPKKSNQFKQAIATAMRNADIKLPTPFASDDYTEN
jgi:hypothetical protein